MAARMSSGVGALLLPLPALARSVNHVTRPHFDLVPEILVSPLSAKREEMIFVQLSQHGLYFGERLDEALHPFADELPAGRRANAVQ
jgi:hypothetical protein